MHEIIRELDLYCVEHFLEKVYVHGYKDQSSQPGWMSANQSRSLIFLRRCRFSASLGKLHRIDVTKLML
ncbi:hypothetical protein TIFTF001_051702 [Ficus carica]|uniref:Uncharacterized protein n=1 Tax=Ficus carica TaxID=3494 RepID=A0AA87ZCJ5_FICCA|nr:hypothetical protein TIFTF001_051702 [Ficus carica]